MHDVVCIYIVGLPKLIIKLRSAAKVVLVDSRDQEQIQRDDY